jgi:hypothetical protein
MLQLSRRSFFIRCDALTEESVSLGFRWLLENADQNRKSTFIAIPSASYLQRETILSVLGEPAVRALSNNGKMNFNPRLSKIEYNQ